MALPPPEARYPLVSYLRAEKSHIDELNRSLQQAANALSKRIAAMGDKSPITRMQARAQEAAIKAQLAQKWSDWENVIAAGQQDVAAAASRVVSEYENELLGIVLTKADMELIAAAEAQRAAAGIKNTMARILSSERPLSQKVYNTESLVSGQVSKLINSALAQGLNARQLAAEVKKFISPSTPGGASYAAKRLARTEINNAFHASSIDRYQRSALVDDVDWHLSTSHPEGDICDSYAADSPYKVNEVPEKPHPQCFCFTTPNLPSREKFVENLMNGEYDDEDWMDEEKLPSSLAPKPTASGAPKIDWSKMGGLDKEAFAQIYGGRSFGPYTTEVSRVSASGLRADKSKVTLKVMDGDQKVGEVIRTFGTDENGRRYAHHDIMFLEEDARGRGFSSEFSKFSEAWYRENGVDYISVEAGLENGGYTWARAGYTWDPAADTPGQVVTGLRSVGDPDLDAWADIIENKPMSEWPLPPEIAAHPRGKQALTGTFWNGIKELN